MAQRLPLLIPYTDGQKWGYADTNERVVIAPQWEQVNFFNNGRARVSTKEAECIIDTQGNYIIPPYRNWSGKLYPSVVGGYYNAISKEGKWGIIDSNNREMLTCLYDKTPAGNMYTASGFFAWDKRQNGYTAIVCRQGRFGIVDTQNRVLIPFEYTGILAHAYDYSSRYYSVSKDENERGIIDARNKVIIPPIYRNVAVDAATDSWFMISKNDHTTVIADTTGRIVWDIPGYKLGFPADSLIPVANRAGKWGLMNYRRELLFPCENAGVSMRKDTIVVYNLFPDSAGRKVQYFKFYSSHTLQEISPWLNNYQYNRQLPPAPPAVFNKYLPHYYQMNIGGKLWPEYRMDSITWVPNSFTNTHLIPVMGIADGDTVIRYTAVIDSNGKYAVAPQQGLSKLKILSEKDSLIAIYRGSPDFTYTVTDYHLNALLSPQPFEVAAAFYHKKRLYAIMAQKHQRQEEPFFIRNWQREATREVTYDYTYHLAAANGQQASPLAPYQLLGFADSNGYLVDKRARIHGARSNGFEAPFEGYFIAKDSLEKEGIVALDGTMLFSKVSFKYERLSRKGPNVFEADNEYSKRMRDYQSSFKYRYLIPIDSSLKDPKPVRGFPYLVDSTNRVLLDSLSVAYVSNGAAAGEAPLYFIELSPPQYVYPQPPTVHFYMNAKGRVYHAVYGSFGKRKSQKPSGSKAR